MTPVGLWRDEDGDMHEIRRRPYGYLVRCFTEDTEGVEFPVENVRWRNDRLKWTLVLMDETRHYETVRIELHRMVVHWKSTEKDREEVFTRVSG